MNNTVTKDPLLEELQRDLNAEPLIGAGEDIPGSEELSFHDIYSQLIQHEDIIVIIERQDEQRLRKGLSAVKAKHVSKMRESGIVPESQVLEFIVHEQPEDLPKNQMKLQIILKQTQGVKIHKVIIPEGM